MARRDYASIYFESEREEYVVYNFHRQTHQKQLRQALLFKLEDFSRVILLVGSEHVGRRYLLESAAYQARQREPTLDLRLVTLDLDGFEPGQSTYADYLAVQMAKRGGENGKVWEGIAQYLHLKIGTPTLAGISWFSIGLELDLPLKDLKGLFERTWKRGPRRKERESLKLFLQTITERQRLVIYIPESGQHPELLQDWLLEDLPLLPNLILVFARPDDPGFNDLYTQGDPLQLMLTPYTREEMPALLTEAFGEHRLPFELGEALWEVTQGYPKALSIKICDLEKNGAIYSDAEGIWRMPPEGVATEGCVRALETDLYEPVSKVLRRLRERGDTIIADHLSQFLTLAGLCGRYIPVQLLTRYLRFSNDEENQLIDVIDEAFIENTEDTRYPLFYDLAYTHPGFPNLAVYVFVNPILQWVLLNRVEEGERTTTATAFYEYLRPVLPVYSRAIATLFTTVLKHTNEEIVRQALESELAWWIGTEDSEALQERLVQRLERREQDPEVLWSVVERTERYWPAYRRLALLDAYANQPEGIPFSRRPDWCLKRGLLLYELGHFEEAREVAREGLEICEPSSSFEGAILSVLASAEQALGHHEAAEPLFQRALAIDEKALGPEHPHVGTY